MEERVISEGIKRQRFFEAPISPVVDQDNGTRDMGELYPFIISGGSNTERYYFTHINDTTEHKFNIRPRYFGDESNYTDAFPKRIIEILRANQDAQIFCVFDWDTVYGNDTRLKKHQEFVNQFKKEIDAGIVTICPSMPSIEYWFLLHYVDITKLMNNFVAVAGVLAPYLKPCFSNNSKPLKKLLKTAKYLKDPIWVENLCADGKLDLAISRAEKNIALALSTDELNNQSYSYVYKVFKKTTTE